MFSGKELSFFGHKSDIFGSSVGLMRFFDTAFSALCKYFFKKNRFSKRVPHSFLKQFLAWKRRCASLKHLLVNMNFFQYSEQLGFRMFPVRKTKRETSNPMLSFP